MKWKVCGKSASQTFRRLAGRKISIIVEYIKNRFYTFTSIATFSVASNLNIFQKYKYHVGIINLAQSDSVFLACTSIPDTSPDLQQSLLLPLRLLDVWLEAKQTWWLHLQSSGYVYLPHKVPGQPKSLPYPLVPIATPQRKISKKPSAEHSHSHKPFSTKRLTYSYWKSP